MIYAPIFPTTPNLYQAAAQRAAAFNLPVTDTPTNLYLQLTEERLELCDNTMGFKPIFVDFIKGSMGYRRQHGGGRKQSLGRAVGLKPGVTPSLVDATAGLGQDAFILAHLGCRVRMVERSPVIAALLHDGLQRAHNTDDLSQWLDDRLSLIFQDARTWLTSLQYTDYPDVIYLDPMYPPRHKTALGKKEMRLFRQLIGNDEDSAELLDIALQRAKHRVVVKRPHFAPPLGNIKPFTSINSEKTRFDVYILSGV